MRLASALFTVVLTALHSQGYAMENLSEFEWEKRVVLIFGRSDDQRTVRQIETFRSASDALTERDMLVVYIGENIVTAVHGDPSGLVATPLRAEAKIGDGEFKVLLVGNDGGVKISSNESITLDEMFSTIDRMPMRRSEISRKNGPNHPQ